MLGTVPLYQGYQSQNKTNTKGIRAILLGSLIGNVMEFYDFMIFAFLAKQITSLFFPLHDKNTGLLLTLSTFAMGYISRPFGSIFFGFIGDRYGRKTALLYSILLMSIATMFIGLLPTFNTIGYLSPVLLILLRLLQGFAVSGEQGGVIVFLSETLKLGKGFLGALMLSSVYVGVSIGAASCLTLNLVFSEQEIAEWAWRLPFFFSIFLGTISLISRLNILESTEFMQIRKDKLILKNPLKHLIKNNPKLLIKTILLIVPQTVCIYLYVVFFPNYFSNLLSSSNTMIITTLNMIFLALLVPILGYFSDKIKPEKMFLWGCITLLIYGLLILNVSNDKNINVLISAQFLLGFVTSLISAPLFAILVESFLINSRYTGVSLTFNISTCIFGGTTPMIATALVNYYGFHALGFYLLIASLLGIVFSSHTRNHYQKNI